jgi:hypothetical protein
MKHVPFIVALLALPTLASAAEKLQFNRDIRPILADKCFACHGPDANHREAELRLDDRASAIESNAIAPGKVDESAIIKRILSDNPKRIMPPPHANKPLSAEQKELLKRWVAEGAEYQGHWAYLAPQAVSVPKDANPIDTLVREHVTKKGLQPSPEADRRTLARRLSFDLLGLPPKIEDVEAFVNDKSPDAYKQFVERLLASPHYGERMAIAWLDAVRFADTIGYHSDNPRNVYPYRDYVIRAFNENKPFDQFTIEQLAGDLLPNATQEQKVASCFNRLLLTTEEGGAQAKDYEARMLGDRVRAVGTVWLGQTIGCCQCHDHKFDPITTRDFYSMGAFFADVQEAAIGKREPGMLVPDKTQEAELSRLQAKVAELQQALDAPRPEWQSAQSAWEKSVLAAVQSAAWSTLKPTQATGEQGTKLQIEKSNSLLVEARGVKPADIYNVTVTTSAKGITAIKLDALSTIVGQGPGRAADGGVAINEISLVDEKKQPVKIAEAIALSETKSTPAAAMIDGKRDKLNGWSPAPGLGVESSAVLILAEPFGDGKEHTLTIRIEQLAGGDRTLGRFRLQATTAAKPADAPLVVLPPDDLVAIIKLEPSKRNAAQQAKLTTHFRTSSRETLTARQQLAEAKAAQANYENNVPRCLIAVSMPTPRTVRILPRGNWMDDSGPIVQAAVPTFLPQPKLTAGQKPTRLDLARWIVSPENPLTARVFVNRVWKQFFGIGLSKTLDDLGSQGETPVQPELLDTLAYEFQSTGWNVKNLVRLIVNSHTYRQVSTASKEQIARDPENRDLACQSRFRLDAELVRDNALAISGLLVPKIGGPSVKPYQPDGYWENLNFPTRTYQADTGENQYRRGLYTWWQRSFLHPSMLAFDAPSREECAADRSRSNIPQQALVLLNDPTYVEAARAFAGRILRDGGSTVNARIDWAWRQALARPPRDDERRVVAEVFAKHHEQFAKDANAADLFLKVGQSAESSDVNKIDLAAWTSVARVILNLHETITRN